MKLSLSVVFGVLLLSSAVLASHADAQPVHAEVDQKDQSKVGSVTDAEVLLREGEKHEFQAEVHRLMDIIINSLYRDREIFLRELISNGSDALDKLRFLALTDKSLMSDTDPLEIRISYDKERRTLTVADTGIGMTKEELIKNLGTLAKSGTTQFVEAASKGGNDALSLIGQFGVGFYSVYLVADTVTVTSKSPKDHQHIWVSTANQTFSIARDPRGDTIAHGTQITLHLKDDANEFLDENALKHIITKYSEFINFPIYLLTHKEVEREVPVETSEDDKTETETEEDVEVKEEEEKKPEMKKVKETVEEWNLMNENKPIWTRAPADVTEEEYNNFFKVLSKGTEDPLSHAHFNAEGGIQFKALLYIPSKAPQDMYDRYYGKTNNLKLYVRRVMIADEFEDFMPRYLSFIKGIVDSDDLPLNVNRETLQKHKVLQLISKKLTRKVLDMLQKLAGESAAKDEDEEPVEQTEEEEAKAKEEKQAAKSKYETFWKEFGKSIKLGVIEDAKNKNKLAPLLRFNSAKHPAELISLEEYMEEMKPKQDAIYFITGENMQQVKQSPFIEKLTKRGYDVLFMVDPLDEYVVGHLTEFEGKKLQSVTKEGLKLGDENSAKRKEKQQQLEEEFKPLMEYLKTVYGDKVEKVTLSSRVASAPAVLVTSQWGWSANMERIMKAQALGDTERSKWMMSKKTLEINPRHPAIKQMLKTCQETPDSEGLKDLSLLMFDSALVTSGFQMEDQAGFAARVTRIMRAALHVDPEAQVEEEEVFEDDEEAEEAEEETEDAEEVEMAEGEESAPETQEEEAPKKAKKPKHNDEL